MILELPIHGKDKLCEKAIRYSCTQKSFIVKEYFQHKDQCKSENKLCNIL